MEVDVPHAGGLGSYDPWAETQDRASSMAIIATSEACAAVTPGKGPFGHTLGTLSAGFSLQEVLSDKQETEGVFWEFCCLEQNKKHGWFVVVVVDQQLFVYALEKVQRTQCFLERLLETLQRCFPQRGYSAGEGEKPGEWKGNIHIHTFRTCLVAQLVPFRVSLNEEWLAFMYFHNFLSSFVSWWT